MPTSTRTPIRARRFARPLALLGAGLATSLTVTLAPAVTAPASAMTSAEMTAVLTAREYGAYRIAREHLGAPYEYGASGPSAFDCSGLTHYSLTHAGFASIPRTAAEQAVVVHRIARASLREGDLIFFDNGYGVYHVAFFVMWVRGRALILHAPYPGARVRFEYIWTNNWFAGTLR